MVRYCGIVKPEIVIKEEEKTPDILINTRKPSLKTPKKNIQAMAVSNSIQLEGDCDVEALDTTHGN